MAKKTFDPNQFGGFVGGNVTRGAKADAMNPAERRAAERAAQAPETPTQTPEAVEADTKAGKEK